MSPRKGRGWQVWVEPSGDIWRCRWKGKFGTGQSVFPYKDDANELAISKRRDFQRMDAGLPEAPKISTAVTVGQWWDDYSSTKKRENPQTFRRFDLPAVWPFADAHSGIALAAITDRQIQDYKYSLEDRYSGDTPQMYYRQVCAFFNAAVRKGIILTSPAKSIKKPLSGGGGGRPLLDSELLPILALAPEQLYRAAVFSLNTMLRINEVVRFDWSWTWREDGLLMGRIPSAKRKTRSKEPEDCIFPITAPAEKVMGFPRQSGRVFQFEAITIQKQLIRLRRKAKLPEDITFHCFRHTGVSRYLAEEGHMEDLLKSHIWDDPRSLLRYVKVAPRTLHRRFGALIYPYPAPKSEAPRSATPRG